MERPSYLSKYFFDWELFNVIIGGKSALDSHSFLSPMYDIQQVEKFLEGYGFDPSNPILKAELFGYFQEALQFIKRYFLKEGNDEGLDLQVPNSILRITDVSNLFLMATGNSKNHSFEDCLWAGSILKVMHTILHADKDLRSNYFQIIQQQIFDRFYKYLKRSPEDDSLFLANNEKSGIPLVDFQTKSKKSRDSVIIKLLHKAENVAEELFDRVGVRFITKNKFDTLRVIKFVQENHVILAHNIKPSRSVNTIVNIDVFKNKHKAIIKEALRSNMPEDIFLKEVTEAIEESSAETARNSRNSHSLDEYRSIQFTCRQLIFYRNPIISKISELKKLARKEESKISKKIAELDISHLSRDIRFFYPYEIQIVDQESNENNTVGESSHEDYKKAQLKTVVYRVFKDLIEFKGMNF